MDIVLHPGAHRTGSTSFQSYLRAVQDDICGQGLAYWGPWRTRKGLFHGVADGTAPPGREGRPAGRVLLNVRGVARKGYRTLIVSDENMLGTPRDNIRSGLLYPGAGQRMARFHAAFGGRVRRVVLQIRSPELYWASLYAYALPRGVSMPLPAQIAALARGQRSWRDVIVDMACAMPGAEICVTVFERFASDPAALLRALTDRAEVPEPAQPLWLNRAPDLAALRAVLRDRGEDPALLPAGHGRWMPFIPQDAALLRAAYAEDLHWLTTGADGLARLIEDPDPDRTRIAWPAGPMTRGQRPHDQRQGNMAQTR
ncbi:hypothetical protein [Aestuariicoccus sp. MJ-SS9]|uniref:hypothetical protein n=1 Tax=Aestuariicoccus sp. MJ-SS9 TaxID=3079855 RepID=UPI002907F7BD|nr:hypothetical protein [Aestuariicoccus sp. MJ-SS9]MDU8913240.1 hypothetical protein [Aestuariicoccus sp. MJ-SS9]